MRWFATISVAVLSIVYLASPFRLNLNAVRHLLHGPVGFPEVAITRDEAHLIDAASSLARLDAAALPLPSTEKAAGEKDAAEQSAAAEEAPAAASRKRKLQLQSAAPEEAPAAEVAEEKALEKDRREIHAILLSERRQVKVAGLDFSTDITAITKALYGFELTPSPTSSDFGSSGGWVMGCPLEGQKDLRDDYLFVCSLDRLDMTKVPRMEIVPSHWWLKRGSNNEPGLMYRPKLDREQEIKAVRRSTIKSSHLCLWIGRENQEEEEVVVLNDASEHCWSHKISVEATATIVDLCK